MRGAREYFALADLAELVVKCRILSKTKTVDSVLRRIYDRT